MGHVLAFNSHQTSHYIFLRWKALSLDKVNERSKCDWDWDFAWSFEQSTADTSWIILFPVRSLFVCLLARLLACLLVCLLVCYCWWEVTQLVLPNCFHTAMWSIWKSCQLLRGKSTVKLYVSCAWESYPRVSLISTIIPSSINPNLNPQSIHNARVKK